MTQMVNYTLSIEADSGYSSTTEGRCTAEQYGDAIAALHGTNPKREWVGLTDEEVSKLFYVSRFAKDNYDGGAFEFYKAAEAKLKEKNTII
jgi:hypothetical protein